MFNNKLVTKCYCEEGNKDQKPFALSLNEAIKATNASLYWPNKQTLSFTFLRSETVAENRQRRAQLWRIQRQFQRETGKDYNVIITRILNVGESLAFVFERFIFVNNRDFPKM